MQKPFRKRPLFWLLLILIPIFWLAAMDVLIHATTYDQEIWGALCACGLPVAFIVIITIAVVK